MLFLQFTLSCNIFHQLSLVEHLPWFCIHILVVSPPIITLCFSFEIHKLSYCIWIIASSNWVASILYKRDQYICIPCALVTVEIFEKPSIEGRIEASSNINVSSISKKSNHGICMILRNKEGRNFPKLSLLKRCIEIH